MKVLLIEPFLGGSHQQWAEGLVKYSKHQVKLLSLPAVHWKWRMHGAAITLAKQFLRSGFNPDLILATDMLDLSVFLSVAGKKASGIRTAMYFHENQLTYPWSPDDQDVLKQRDNHYAFINYTSALVADRVFFNSAYHRRSFLGALPSFLRKFPDHLNLETVKEIAGKSRILPLGMELEGLEICDMTMRPKRAVVLWNHRWEYDKNPEAFFKTLYTIQERGWDFNLVVLGQEFSDSPAIFGEARERLQKHILHWGYVASREEYAGWLHRSDILPVTSRQDFFGGSVVEAMYCNVKPLLPRRLAYDEHVPDALFPTFSYEENVLANKLQRWIKDVAVLRNQQTRGFVEKYDWNSLIETYDHDLET